MIKDKKTKKKKIAVLAYSGGLDTSFCIPYLQEKGYEVIAVTVNTGGFEKEELEQIKKRASELKVKKYILLERKKELFEKMVTYIIKGNLLRGKVYPLCVGPERVIQATEIVKIAKKEKAAAIAHGSTGAGNDQIRFDVAIRVFAPKMKIIAPIRELSITRKEEIAYLKRRGFKTPKVSKDYSINYGLLGTTIGGKETLNTWKNIPDEAYPTVRPIEKTPEKGKQLDIGFERGLPISLNRRKIKGLSLIERLYKIGARHGVGKDIHAGETFFGIKGRIAFEAPAALILIKAHQELEKMILTSRQRFWKDLLSNVYGHFLHEALYFDPIMRDIEALIDSSQKYVTGRVKIKLHKGNIILKGVKSKYSPLSKKIATYGEETLFWDGKEAQGFCKIYGFQSMLVNMFQKGVK